MADEITVIVEPPLPEIVVVVEPPPAEVAVTLSEVGLTGPPGDPTTLLDTIRAELEPSVDFVLLFENALA